MIGTSTPSVSSTIFKVLLRPAKTTGVSDLKRHPGQPLSRSFRLKTSKIREGNVDPPGKAVLRIPKETARGG